MATANPLPIGQKAHMLTAIGSAPHRGGRRAIRVRCDCGSEKNLALHDFGRTVSCGCESRRRAAARTAARATHHLTGTPEHRVWVSMRNRCNNPRNYDYPSYGGRGIRVCGRWDDFCLFLADMGPRPTPSHSIDRIDNDGAYEPSNCRWATHKQQMRNRGNTPRVEFGGQLVALRDVADELGIDRNTLLRRYQQGDRPPDLFRPVVQGANQWRGR